LEKWKYQVRSIFKEFLNLSKIDRTYLLKKADFDGVSKSAFGLSKGDYLGIFN